jgi:anti-sigma factor RsiW
MRRKCSNRQLVSVYFDGELDSPWKEKMEIHIAGCEICAKQMDEYKKNSLSLAPVNDELLDGARQRVLQKLETGRFTSGRESRSAFVYPVWKRRVSIPIPAAAAVVFMLIALAFLWITRTPVKTETPNMAITAETEIIPDITAFSGMDSVLQYLGGSDTGDIIILKLPESRNFASYGEPAIVKAADYTRYAPKGRKQ